MAFINAGESALDHYLKTGELSFLLTIDAQSIKSDIKHGKTVLLSQKERQVYEKILADLAIVNKMVKNIKGNDDPNQTLSRHTYRTENGYIFSREKSASTHNIYIDRDKDNFHWVLGVLEDNSDIDIPQGNITGYFHIETNGNLADLNEALAATKQFFPKVNPHNYHLQSETHLLQSFESLLREKSPHLKTAISYGNTHDYAAKTKGESDSLTFSMNKNEFSMRSLRSLTRELLKIDASIKRIFLSESNNEVHLILSKQTIKKLLFSYDKQKSQQKTFYKNPHSIWQKISIEDKKSSMEQINVNVNSNRM